MQMSNLPPWPDMEALFWLALTGALYVVFFRWRKAVGEAAWAQPLLWAAGLLMAILVFLDIDPARYQKGGDWLIYLLALSTVSIAVPIYDNRHIIRAAAFAFLGAMSIGSIIAAGSAVAMVALFDFEATLRASLQATLATKSITSPFAYGVADEIGGLPVLAMGIVILTGNFAVLCAARLFALGGLSDPRAQGLALGVIAHGIGTAEAVRRSALMGSFAGLAMGVNGVLTSLVLPLVFL